MKLPNATLVYFSYPTSDEWKATQVLHVITLALSLCFIVMLFIYLRRHESLDLTGLLTYNRFTVIKVTILAGVLFVCKICMDIVLIHTPYMGFEDCQKACERAGDGSTFFGVLSLFFTLFYLWLRLHVLHCKQTKLFGKKTTVCFTALMWTCLNYLIIGTVISMIGWIFPEAYSCTQTGCIVRDDPVLDMTMVIAPIWTFSVQAFILILLIYVLLRNNPTMRPENRAHVKDVARRLILCAGVSVISDAVSYTVILFAGSRTRSAVAVPYNMSLFVNIAALLCSSDDPTSAFRSVIYSKQVSHQAMSSPQVASSLHSSNKYLTQQT